MYTIIYKIDERIIIEKMREFELYCFVSNSNNNLEFRLINNHSKMAINCDCESVEDLYYSLEEIKGEFSYSDNTVHYVDPGHVNGCLPFTHRSLPRGEKPHIGWIEINL